MRPAPSGIEYDEAGNVTNVTVWPRGSTWYRCLGCGDTWYGYAVSFGCEKCGATIHEDWHD